MALKKGKTHTRVYNSLKDPTEILSGIHQKLITCFVSLFALFQGVFSLSAGLSLLESQEL